MIGAVNPSLSATICRAPSRNRCIRAAGRGQGDEPLRLAEVPAPGRIGGLPCRAWGLGRGVPCTPQATGCPRPGGAAHALDPLPFRRLPRAPAGPYHRGLDGLSRVLVADRLDL